MAESLGNINPLQVDIGNQQNNRVEIMEELPSYDDALRRVLEMSRIEEEERKRRQEQEDEELMKIIELSLLEK